MIRRAFLLGCTAVLLGVPGAVAAENIADEGATAEEAVAENAPTDRVDLGASKMEIEVQRELWRDRFRAARERVAVARTRSQDANEAYTRMRHRNRDRGEEKVKIVQEFGDSETELSEATAALRDLFDDAHRAGVPPGWLRMDRAELPAPPADPAPR